MKKIRELERKYHAFPVWAVTLCCLIGLFPVAVDGAASVPQPTVRVGVDSAADSRDDRTGLAYFPVLGDDNASLYNGFRGFLEHNRGSVRGNSDTLLYGEFPLDRPPGSNRAIAGFQEYFQSEIHQRVQEWLDRFYRYRPLVKQVFAEFGLPQELIYVSLVESGFNPRAFSRARAAGPWQFIASTGRRYGLRVDWYVDERRDPMKSTVAAAWHLRDLYDQFGSWPLALAAYNAGAGKIRRTIRKAGTDDFWTIAKTRALRPETRQYVPKFMAIKTIAENPAWFGFDAGQDTVHQYEEVHVGKSVHLRTVSKATTIPFQELRRLNPELRRSVVPPHQEGYYLKVPVGMGGRLESAVPSMAAWTPVKAPVRWYRVRRGDSLSVIARRFGMRVRTLRNLNGLSSTLIRIGQRLRVSNDDVPAKQYRVRRGDSLWSIARQFRVKVQALKAWNNLRSNRIHARQMLRIAP